MRKLIRFGWLGAVVLALGCGGVKELGPATETKQVPQEEINKQMSEGTKQQNMQNIPEQFRGQMRGSTPPTK